MLCLKCKKHHAGNQAFCPFCGYEQKTQGDFSDDARSQKIGVKKDNPYKEEAKPFRAEKDRMERSGWMEKLKSIFPAGKSSVEEMDLSSENKLENRDEKADLFHQEEVSISGESDTFKQFRQRLTSDSINDEFTGIDRHCNATIILGNRTFQSYIVRIKGVHSQYFSEHHLSPFRKKKVIVKCGSYTIEGFSRESTVIWLGEMGEGEIHYAKTSPINLNMESDMRYINLKNQTYDLLILTYGFFNRKKRRS